MHRGIYMGSQRKRREKKTFISKYSHLFFSKLAKLSPETFWIFFFIIGGMSASYYFYSKSPTPSCNKSSRCSQILPEECLVPIIERVGPPPCADICQKEKGGLGSFFSKTPCYEDDPSSIPWPKRLTLSYIVG